MRMKVESLAGGDAVGLAGGGGGDTTCGPHRTLLSGGDSWLSWADDEVDRRLCALGEQVATSGFTSGLTSSIVNSAQSTSDARGSLLHKLNGSRFRLASSSRDGRGGDENGGAEQYASRSMDFGLALGSMLIG